jgi:hypothetical protein
LFIIYLATGIAYYTLRETWPELLHEVNWLLDTSVESRPYSEFITDVFKSILFLIGGYYAVYLIVIFSNLLNRMITSSVLDSLAIQSDGVVYLFMAIAVFFLAVFVMWRGIVLTIFWAYLLLFLGHTYSEVYVLLLRICSAIFYLWYL